LVVPPRSFLTITYQLVVPTWLVPGDYLAGVGVTDDAIEYEVLNPGPNVEIRSEVPLAQDCSAGGDQGTSKGYRSRGSPVHRGLPKGAFIREKG
jgi:hypothetical protein